MQKKSILLIAEPSFHLNHVGVQRVIRYHWRKLREEGHFVTLAAPIDGHLARCSATDILVLMDERGEEFSPPTPDWSSGKSFPEQLPSQKWGNSFALSTSIWKKDEELKLIDFDESVITTPWLCALPGGIPEGCYSKGIVYDLVPTFLALGVLRMPKFADVARFAYEHAVGFDFFIKHAEKISCISESTRNDFLSVFGESLEGKMEVCIPFDDFGIDAQKESPQKDGVLLLNVLDPRKNIATVVKALKSAARALPIKVIIIGRERMAFDEVKKYMQELAEVCASVEWYRSPSDSQVEYLMKKSKVLFFPSLYEGLGLPILEAQAKGLPVISSNGSSCGEINLNPSLTADAYDYHSFVNKINGVLQNELPILDGEKLRMRQTEFLMKRNRMEF